MKYDYFIIGNSAAAVGCIEGIRRESKNGKICVVSDENYRAYGRPLISYFLWGKTSEENMLKYRPKDFYEKNGADLILGTRAVKINPDSKTVSLSNGDTYEYGKLLVAAGSRPFVPQMAGFETVEKKFNFMTLDDAKALRKAVDKDSKVLIVGAGLIGLKCAEGISDSVKSITVVDLANRILPSILDEEGSKIVQEYIEGHGIKFYLSDSVDEFRSGIASLKSGTRIEYDVVVIAVGVRPNSELVAEAGGNVNRGIVTNLKCETSLKDVYAAGDCSESLDSATGKLQVMALLPNAYIQGEAAGINMAGGMKLYDDAIPMNSIGFWDIHVTTAGSYEGREIVRRDDDNYKKLIVSDDKKLLKGFILIGDIKRAGIYTRLIREKVPLDTIDFDEMIEKPQEMAFPSSVRKMYMGGVM